MNVNDAKVAVIGLGYVGLPLAVEFGKRRPVIGFDIDRRRISELTAGHDRTLEVGDAELVEADIRYTADESCLDEADVFIVTAPTPIDRHKQPDLTPLLSASRAIGRHLRKASIVIYESTVYPGATEEECVPVLAEVSGMTYNSDFFVGYSPERINPGDRKHRVNTIIKITSGSTPEVADFVDDLYRSIVTAGTHRAPSIRVAEAAKVIENTQRDVNIALVNELALLFNKLGIDTEAVLDAAGTKWNFLPFRPGLVGGHCIGVDPYYLTHKAAAVGYHPEIILAGRRLNDAMGGYVAEQTAKAMSRMGITLNAARVLICGVAFKENTPDLRNSRVIDIITSLREYGIQVEAHDPWVDPVEARTQYGLELVGTLEVGRYDALIVAVAHHQYRDMGAAGMRSYGRTEGHFLYDLKSLYSKDSSDLRL